MRPSGEHRRQRRQRRHLQLRIRAKVTQSADVDDWKKLGRCIRYLKDTRDMPLTLEASSMSTINWWVDASFAVHKDYKSHTGATVSFGKGHPISVSSKQKLNTTSSTVAELVGIHDALNMVLWVRNFLLAQGYEVKDNVIHQDNMSTMLLANNGKRSSGKKTRHIEIRYFFITDNIQKGNASVKYCPTEDMIADFFTKPLQGSLFRKLRALIMNYYPSNHNTPVDGQECVGDTGYELDESAQTNADISSDQLSIEDPIQHRSWVDVVKNGPE